MRELAAQLLKTIRKQDLLRAGDRVAVAVSGGADSVALLCLLEELRGELGIVLSVAHVNHKLRGAESDEDERFVAELAAARGLAFHAVCAPLNAARPGAARAKSGVEAAARQLRYDFFRQLMRQERIAKVATAHTLDDQAETVLLRMFRGAGIRGLAGILPRMKVSTAGVSEAEVVRPLLGYRRADLRDFLQSRGQSWREDSSNDDVAFLRNRVRQRLLPLIAEEFGNAAIEHIAELAEIARAEEEWASGHQLPVSTEVQETEGRKKNSPANSMVASTLDAARLLALPLALQRRQIRAWLEANAAEESISFRLIEEIRELARLSAGKALELSSRTGCLGTTAREARGGDSNAANARRKKIRMVRRQLVLERGPSSVCDYEYALAVPGEVEIPELGACIQAQLVNVNSVPENERNALLDPERVGTKVVIRNWRAGDRYQPAHTAAQKKLKELLSDRHATGAAKKLWPVAIAESGDLLWVRAFAVSSAFRPRGERAILIRQTSGS